VELGYLVQLIARGQVLCSSGVQRKVVNSFVYRVTNGPPIAADRLLYWNGFAAATWQWIAAILNVSYVGVAADVLYPNTPGDVQTTVAVPQSGGRAGARASLNVCAYVNQSTGLRGRSFVGSKRWGPLSTSDIVQDELSVPGDPAWIAAVANLSQIFGFTSTAGPVITCTPVVWSRLLSAGNVTIPPGIGADIRNCHLNRTLGQWKHRRERVVR
jgi:hypothetical protein